MLDQRDPDGFAAIRMERLNLVAGNGLAGFLPGVESALQIEDLISASCHFDGGCKASFPTPAVQSDRLVFRADLFRLLKEIGTVPVYVDCPGDMPGLEFLRCADIDENDLIVDDFFFEGRNIKVLKFPF